MSATDSAERILPRRRRFDAAGGSRARSGRGRGGRPHHERPPLRVNLTPLIDVTFLLIVFFVLVAEITRTRIAEDINLPQPDPSAAVERDPETGALILNLVPTPDREGIAEYRVAGRSIPATAEAQALSDLTAWLRDLAAEEPAIALELRADRSLEYARVFPVMKAISAAGITKVELVVSEPDPLGRAGTP